MKHEGLLESLFGIATVLAGRQEFDSRQSNIPFSVLRRPDWPTQPPIQGNLSHMVKRPRREANHSLPSSAEVKNGGAIPPYVYVSVVKVKVFLRLAL
jgi:hypothetical protein